MHGRGRHGPPLLVVLQQPVQLLQVSHDVVLDVGRRDLEPHAAAVKGAREVAGKHFVDHPGHDWNDLFEKEVGCFSLTVTQHARGVLQESPALDAGGGFHCIAKRAHRPMHT